MRQISFVAFLFVIGLTGSPLGAVAADETVWSALVLGTNKSEPAADPQALNGYGKQMRRVFGYNSFEIVGENTARMVAGDNNWLVPSKELFLRVASTSREQEGYVLNIELFEGQKLLIKTSARLGPKSPLFIRGPLWGKGQLIMVLMVK